MSRDHEHIAGEIERQAEVTKRLAYRLHCDCGMELPLHLAKEIGTLLESDAGGIWAQKLSTAHWSMFLAEHQEDRGAYAYVTHDAITLPQGLTQLSIKLRYYRHGVVLHGSGGDILGAVIDALGLRFEVLCCSVCADTLTRGNVAFVEISVPNGETACGVGAHEKVTAAEVKAMLVAVNHALNQGALNDVMVAATVE